MDARGGRTARRMRHPDSAWSRRVRHPPTKPAHLATADAVANQPVGIPTATATGSECVRVAYIHDSPQHCAVVLGVVRGHARRRLSEATKHDNGVLRRRATYGAEEAVAIGRFRAVENVRQREPVE